MVSEGSQGISRRSVLRAFAATAVAAAPTYTNASGFLRGGGDIRTLSMYSGRTGERINTVYWIEGKYIKDAVSEINKFMRDWRTGGVIQIDLRTIDIMAAAHRLTEANDPFTLLSGYRSPQTNAMLRKSSRNVAKKSFHMEGKAADLRLPGRSVRQLASAATSFRAGGVGRYSGSNFVHVDCGPLRTWGR